MHSNQVLVEAHLHQERQRKKQYVARRKISKEMKDSLLVYY